MNKPVIAVDCDEVLMPLHEAFLKHHNEVYGTAYNYPDTEGRYYLEQFTGESHEITMDKLKTYTLSEAFLDLQPIPGAIETIKYLTKHYTLVIITARQDFMQEVTKISLKQHFGTSFKSVHLTPYAGKGKHTSKLEIAQSLDAQYMIDDNPSVVNECAEAGIRAILFGDYHWNKTDTLPRGVTRCTDWAAVGKYFDARS